MPGLQVFALLLGLLGTTAEVTAESLDVYDQPGGAAIRTGRIRRGDRVVVRGDEGGGWLAIAPPHGSFDWIEEDSLEETGGGRARIVGEKAAVRAGSLGARLPGPPGITLNQGATVRLLERKPLAIRQGGTTRTWRAIEPPAGDVRYIRDEGVDRGLMPPATDPISPQVRRAARTIVAPVEELPTAPFRAGTALGRIDDRHRAVLGGPVESWRLDLIAEEYQALLNVETDPATRAAIQARLDQIDRQERLAKDARAFRALVERSRRRDAELSTLRARLAPPPGEGPNTYDARGLLQPSSKEIDGQRVYALIGADGETSAYLDFPPGLSASPMVGHRVGVRGLAHFDESLNTRLFLVRDLDLLDD